MKKNSSMRRGSGFTLLETVIAIGVLAVLLTGFIAVFAPAAAGIKKAIDVEVADRLASTVTQELVTLRENDNQATGFEKAFEWIQDSNNQGNALLVYQYRGKTSGIRADGTAEPEPDARGNRPGEDYVLQTMVRQKGDADLAKDLEALEGNAYLVKCKQLIFKNGQMVPGTAGEIADPKNGNKANNAAEYPEAVIAFAAEFYPLPAKSAGYVQSNSFGDFFSKATKPVFTRNLAVRR
jgi:type II secretory pathway pseudopilin PulG